MEVKVTVPLNRKYVYNFLMHHTYFSFIGYVGILISLCAIGAAVFTWGKVESTTSILLIFAGLMFTVIQPLILYSRAGKSASQLEAYKIPMTYTFNSKGMYIEQGADAKLFRWDEIIKITSTRMSVLVYVGKQHGFILTKEALDGKVDDLKLLVKQYATAGYIKIK